MKFLKLGTSNYWSSIDTFLLVKLSQLTMRLKSGAIKRPTMKFMCSLTIVSSSLWQRDSLSLVLYWSLCPGTVWLVFILRKLLGGFLSVGVR